MRRYYHMHVSVCASLSVSLFACLLFHSCPVSISQVVSRLILRLCASEVILQEGLQVLKRVPLIRLPPPALQHEFVERGRAAGGTGHPVTPLHLFQHLTVVHT